jgi:hypothetical protein
MFHDSEQQEKSDQDMNNIFENVTSNFLDAKDRSTGDSIVHPLYTMIINEYKGYGRDEAHILILIREITQCILNLFTPQNDDNLDVWVNQISLIRDILDMEKGKAWLKELIEVDSKVNDLSQFLKCTDGIVSHCLTKHGITDFDSSTQRELYFMFMVATTMRLLAQVSKAFFVQLPEATKEKVRKLPKWLKKPFRATNRY